MSKGSGFKVFLFILFVCKFFHFNAPFFEDFYRKHFVLVEISAQILSTHPRADNIAYLPESALSFDNLLRIVTIIDALTVQNTSSSRPFGFIYGFYLEVLFAWNRTEQRQSYIFGSKKAEEYRQQLEQNPEEEVATTIFVYPDTLSRPYLALYEVREANNFQIQAFFYSLIFLAVIAVILFGQTPHLISLKILAFVLLFFIFTTYETRVFIYFFGSCFIYLYYKIVVIIYRRFYLRPRMGDEK